MERLINKAVGRVEESAMKWDSYVYRLAVDFLEDLRDDLEQFKSPDEFLNLYHKALTEILKKSPSQVAADIINDEFLLGGTLPEQFRNFTDFLAYDSNGKIIRKGWKL